MATVGLEWSTALSTRMPFARCRSRNEIFGRAPWARRTSAQPSEIAKIAASINKRTNFCCFIKLTPEIWIRRMLPGFGCSNLWFVLLSTQLARRGFQSRSIEIKGITIGLVFIFLSALHGLLKFFFKNAIAIFHRIQLLSKNLFAHLFLLVESF